MITSKMRVIKGNRCFFAALFMLGVALFSTHVVTASSIGVSIIGNGDDGSSANITLPLGQEMGSSKQRATVSVNSNYRYVLSLSVEGDGTLVSETDTTKKIPVTTTNSSPLKVNSWGYAIPGQAGFDNSGYDSSDQSTLLERKWSALPINSDGVTILDSNTSNGANSVDVYFGAHVDPGLRTGNYSTVVRYEVTAEPTIAPTVAELSPNTFAVNQTTNKQISLVGELLDSVNSVFVDLNGNSVADSGELCSNISVEDESLLHCTLPPITKTGTYKLYASNIVGKSTGINLYIVDDSTRSVYDPLDNVRVDYDKNMIPIKYNYSKSAWEIADIANAKNWFDYSSKLWANAATVTNPDNYRDKTAGTTVNQDDILGFWVYIPRYSYEVMRPNSWDKVAAPQNFNIKFETTNDLIKTPVASCNARPIVASDMWIDGTANNDISNIKAKDYRTCNADKRTYPGNNSALINKTTWATHPAFFFKGMQLNGIWVGKFEVTGHRTDLTIKPNQRSNTMGYPSEKYLAVKSMGVNDPSNTSPNTSINGLVSNSHHLAKASTSMINSRAWGAVAYLSASVYGAGFNGVKTNTATTNGVNADGRQKLIKNENGVTTMSMGITGCGPASSSSEDFYDDGTPLDVNLIESPTACSVTHPERSYTGAVGVLASTTNNNTGIYDMSGGNWDYTASGIISGYSTNYFDKYENLPKPVWSLGTDQRLYGNDFCGWEMCGGQALHETKTIQSVDKDLMSWNGDGSLFATPGDDLILRGGRTIDSDSISNKWAGYVGSAGRSGVFTHAVNSSDDASFTTRAMMLVY